jgi:hypothetical protein
MAAETPVHAGAESKAGLDHEPAIIEVTNLDDDGEGSLRAALRETGARVVVFKVAGTIALESDLRISKPYVTLAGQTAPAPGILLTGHKLRINTHDAVIQHIALRPNWAAGDVPDNADGITIGNCSDCDQPSTNILLQNISVSWAVDENIGTWGEGLAQITVRDSIVAEALVNAGHEKGAHSMGLLIGDDVQAVEIVGNIFASNDHRNPVINPGASAYIANNFVYNPGRHAIHAYRGDNKRATLIGNVVEKGPGTNSKMRWFLSQDEFPDGYLFSEDNHCCGGRAEGPGDPPLLNGFDPPVVSDWVLMPASQVRDYTLRFAGTRPLERNPIDQRIIGYIKTGGGELIDSPEQVGGFVTASASDEAAPTVPEKPYEKAGDLQKTRLEAWLCLLHYKVGGPPTLSCPESPENLKKALNWNIH